MNIIFVACTLVVTISAIRVPTVWPDETSETKQLRPLGYGSYHRRISVNNRENFRIYPRKTKVHKKYHVHKKPYAFSKLPPRVHSHKYTKKTLKRHKPRESPWVPITTFNNTTYKSPIRFDLKQFPKEYYQPAFTESVTRTSNPLYQNYRDDKTYEQEETDDEKITEPLPNIQRPSITESDHEKPSDIPTAPIYPGEGKWAKPGQKYKPFISKQKYSDLPEDSEEKPDGYEIFEKGKRLYDNKQVKFDNTQRKEYPDSESKENHNEEIGSSEDDSEGFVPSTMYVQVRKTEDEEHLPSNSDEAEGGRLKEVIKDSKIHTIYTEEGYEDSAYDHAGHEKEAEDSQGYNEYNKKEEKEHKPTKVSLKNHRTETDQNEDESSKIYQLVKDPNETKKKKYTPRNKNKLVKTELVKTMKVKEDPNGDHMEITGEIKTLTNPSNEQQIIELIPEIIHNQNLSNRKPQTESKETSTIQEISTTQFPSKIRRKRFTNDFPKIDVKTDFINGVIGNDNQKYIAQAEEEEKYPYYNSENTNPNSPLRYSVNLNNIPLKTEGRMAFYEQANKIQCPEVDDDIEAIPERIRDVEKSINNGDKLEDSEEAGKSPRLGKLGNRIDCFKRKYFGENPLDSPFFKEKEIESVPPLFKVLHERSAGFQAHHMKTKEPVNNNMKRKKYHSKFSLKNKEQPSVEKKQNSVNNMDELDSDEIVNNVRVNSQSSDFRPSYEEATMTPEVEIIKVDTFKGINHVTTQPPTVSLITTPNYSIDITPKHIYDQIQLLDYIPEHVAATVVSFTENPREGKLVEDVTETAQWHMRPKHHNYVPLRPQRKTNKKRPQFDVKSFIQDQSRRVTITPNSYGTEENLAYEQTPLDQMNVFADVINNIRNGSNDPLRVEAATYHKPNYFNTFQNPAIRMKVPPKRIHIKTPDSVGYSNERKVYYRSTTIPTTIRPTTKKSKRGSIRYSVTTEKEVNYDDYDFENDYGKKDVTVKTLTSPMVDPDEIEEDEDTEVSGSHTTETIYKPPVNKAADIVGLVPPSRYHYRTIYQPIEELHTEPIVSESEVINNYHVLGMKPPSSKQKVYDYSDFQRLLEAKNHKYRNHRRGKRSPNRKSYFEVVRGQNSEYEEAKQDEEDDDYEPHRPKNWHWDEKLKKIVYDKPDKEESSDVQEEEDEIVLEEIEDSTPKNIQQTTTRRSITSTTPLNGPSYVDFVQLLKSKKEYVSIPDPTTTKDGIQMETTSPSTTTAKTNPTKPPEFLSFVSKLRNSESYKLIEEKNKTKVTTTTTELPEDEEEEDEDTEPALSNIQNAPGRGAVDIGQNLKIFDVNDFLPKVKTYSPRTEIDYSKYKTIQRARPSTTTQPTEDSTEENEKIEQPNPPFVIEEPVKQPSETSTEGKLEIFEVSRATTPSTTSTTTIKLQKTRRRRPTTTHKTIAPSSTNSNENRVAVFPKPKRVYPRRRPTHIRSRTTTPKTEEDAKPEDSHKVVTRSHTIVERNPKIISLEEIIKDLPKKLKEKNETSSQQVSVDDILKNINMLKEVSIEETVSDYPLDSKNEEESADGTDEYFEGETTKLALDDGGTTNRKLVISKNKQQGMFRYASVR